MTYRTLYIFSIVLGVLGTATFMGYCVLALTLRMPGGLFFHLPGILSGAALIGIAGIAGCGGRIISNQRERLAALAHRVAESEGVITDLGGRFGNDC